MITVEAITFGGTGEFQFANTVVATNQKANLFVFRHSAAQRITGRFKWTVQRWHCVRRTITTTSVQQNFYVITSWRANRMHMTNFMTTFFRPIGTNISYEIRYGACAQRIQNYHHDEYRCEYSIKFTPFHYTNFFWNFVDRFRR